MGMKKTIILTLLLLVAVASTQAQSVPLPYYAPTTTATVGLHGPVKELEMQEVYYFDGEDEAEDTLYLHFDQKGRLLERNSLWHAEYPYEIHIYSGDLLTEVICWNWEDTIRLFYHYSADGCLDAVRCNYYAFLEEKRTEDTSHILCDELCRIIMEEKPNMDSTFYTYNSAGHLATMSGNYYSNSFEYNKQGRLTREVHINGAYKSITEYIRNEHGDVTEYKRTSSDSTTGHHHYEYTYDNHGNWLTRREGSSITTRKITYYE